MQVAKWNVFKPCQEGIHLPGLCGRQILGMIHLHPGRSPFNQQACQASVSSSEEEDYKHQPHEIVRIQCDPNYFSIIYSLDYPLCYYLLPFYPRGGNTTSRCAILHLRPALGPGCHVGSLELVVVRAFTLGNWLVLHTRASSRPEPVVNLLATTG